MRRLRVAALLVSVGVGLAAIAPNGFAANPVTGANGNTQGLKGNFAPKKLSKSKFTPVSLEIFTHLTTSNPSGLPVPARQAVLDFDKDSTFFTKGFPTCNQAKIESTSTEQALEACKRAKIGSGTAKALLPIGKQIFSVEPKVTVFNGQPNGGKPVILLHAYAEKPIQVTTVLSGPLTRINKQGYGPRIDLNVPPLGGGAGTLTDVHVVVKKAYAYKGKRRSFFSAKCTDKTLKARGKFVYADGEALTPTVQRTCKQKRSPRHPMQNRRA